MVDKILIIILILSCLDIFFTYRYVSTFHKMYPDKDYKVLEGNPILRFSWEKFGLDRGMIYGGILIIIGWILVSLILSTNWKYFAMGTLAMMVIYHMLNWQQLMVLKRGLV